MTKDNYIVILAWMNDLGLSLVEKTVYSIIYGFSQDGASEFSGSRQYLADWCGCASLRTIDAALAKLVDRGLISKRVKMDKNVRFCSYVANCTGRAKFAQGDVQNFQGGSAKIAHNNIVDNAEDKSSANRGYMERADARTRTRETTQSFDFPGALVALGVDRKTAEDWTACRKSKGARNSESEFNFVANEIRTVCARDGVTPQQCVAFAAGNTWRGFKASWEETKQIKTNGTTKYDPRTGRKIYTGDTI